MKKSEAYEKAPLEEKQGFLNYKVQGIPLKMFLMFAIPIFIGMYTQSYGTDIGSTIAWLFTLGIIANEIGERIPIFNTWLGGGGMMLMLLPSFLVSRSIIPEKYVTAAANFYSDSGVDFQTLFICLLMMGALLAIDRETLLKSLVRFIPTALAGVFVAGIFGTVVGQIMGYSLADMWIYYVLPIMGGGNGGGAIPMSQIYEQVTGLPRDAYYAVALAILTFANSICIVAAALLNKLGLMFPNLTGDGKSIMRNSNSEASEKQSNIKKDAVKPTLEEIGSGFLVMGAIFGIARLISRVLLPTVFGVQIHQYAYFVILLTIVNAAGILTPNITAGIRTLQGFFTKGMMPMVLCGVGVVMMDFNEFISAVNINNLILATAIVIGAVVGTGVVGYLFGFYPIDSAITAGLCMANRGGGGDVVILAAGKRVELMPYAAIASRLGGGLVLVLASFIFSLLLT